MKPRHLRPVIRRDMSRFPAVFLGGPRQSGKSTLFRQLAQETGDARVITFDDINDRTFARRNPQEFIGNLHGTMILDELQRVPEIFPPLKLSIDRDRRTGRFLLTGSAHYLMLPKVTESLAGRVALETLWPFSQGEIEGTPDGFSRPSSQTRSRLSCTPGFIVSRSSAESSMARFPKSPWSCRRNTVSNGVACHDIDSAGG